MLSGARRSTQEPPKLTGSIIPYQKSKSIQEHSRGSQGITMEKRKKKKSIDTLRAMWYNTHKQYTTTLHNT